MSRNISFAKAVNEALFIAMELDKKVLCYGLGVDDPKHIFYKLLRSRSPENDIHGPFKHKHQTSIERVVSSII